MKIVITGQSGIGKKEYLGEVIAEAEKNGKALEVHTIGELMIKEHPEDVTEEDILDLPLVELTILRRCVMKRIIEASAKIPNLVVDTHAVFRWRWGLFLACDVDLIQQLAPDMFITIIDDADRIRSRLAGKKYQLDSLTDVLLWREEEVIMTQLIAKMLDKPHYIVARRHSPNVIYRLVFHQELPSCYLSFPITGVPKAVEDRVKEYKAEVNKQLICFDPYTIEERKFLVKAIALRNDLRESYVKAIRPVYDDLVKRVRERHEPELEEGNIAIAPLDQVADSHLKTTQFKMLRDGSPREFELGEILSIEHAIEGQIIARDFSLIDQADFLIMYIAPEVSPGQEPSADPLTWKPSISAGCQTELKYAFDKRKKERCIIWEGREEALSPWVKELTTNISKSLEELLKYLRSKGYLR